MYDQWPYLTKGRAILLILALVGVGYLFLQTQQGPAILSNWSGNPFAASAAGGLPQAQLQGIAFQAAPQTGRGQSVGDPDVPSTNPLGLPNTVITQGYG